jgi:dTDP-4-dehydrorhamnose reductase
VSCQRDKILIIGGSGYVGGYLSSFLNEKCHVFSTFFLHEERVSSGEAVRLDIRNPDSVAQVIRTVRPDVIYLLSYSLNDLVGTVVRGASHVVRASESVAARIIYLSTDVVFGGDKRRYFEYDIPDYITDYGRAKFEAENIVLHNGGYVVRTSLVYGFQPMDVRTSMLLTDLRKGVTSTAYFSDEFRCPIFVNDLCFMLAQLIDLKPPGILHMVGPECMSRMDFACKVAKAFNFSVHNVRTALLKDSGLKRPQYLCLDASLAQKVLNYRICSVDEVLSENVAHDPTH